MAAKRIFFVDDDDDIRAVAQRSLELVGGWEAMTASCAREGLDQAVTAQPDAILLDVMMPEMDGPITFQHLQANQATSNSFLSASNKLMPQTGATKVVPDLGCPSVAALCSSTVATPGLKASREKAVPFASLSPCEESLQLMTLVVTLRQELDLQATELPASQGPLENLDAHFVSPSPVPLSGFRPTPGLATGQVCRNRHLASRQLIVDHDPQLGESFLLEDAQCGFQGETVDFAGYGHAECRARCSLKSKISFWMGFLI